MYLGKSWNNKQMMPVTVFDIKGAIYKWSLDFMKFMINPLLLIYIILNKFSMNQVRIDNFK